MVEIQYELRERDLVAFNDHQLKNSERVQKVLRRHQASIPAVLILIALVVWFYYQDTLSAAWIGISAGVWGLAAPFYIGWSARRKILRMYAPEEKERILGTYTLRAEPDALVEISRAGESRIKWEDILRIEAGKNYAFIFVTLDSALIIPRATVTAGDIAEFFDDCQERIEKAS
jgi:hypothetical protein